MGLLSRSRTAPPRKSAAIALPRVPAFLAPRGVSASLSIVDTWPALATSREAALSIPTVKTCRDLIVGAAAQMGVNRYRGTERIPAGTLITQPDPDTTWAATLAGTLEDLIYEGRAYWRVLARDGVATERLPQGYPVRARWIPVGDVTPDTTPSSSGSYSRLRGYHVAGERELVEPENMIRFDGVLPGVLYAGADAIANALALETKALQLANVDLPAGTLTNQGAPLSKEEGQELVDGFEAARRNRTVAWLQDVEYKREQLTAEDLQLIEARANAATEMARLHNVPVAMVSASPSGGASAMLYSNLGSQLALMVSGAVAPHLSTIEQTLSLPTVTPNGQAVAFDVVAFLRSDPSELSKYVLELLEADVIDRLEARTMLGIGAPGSDASLQPGTV